MPVALRHSVVGARNEQPAFMTSTQASTARIWGRGLFLSRLVRGLVLAEEPLFERNPVHDSRTVLCLNAPRGTASRARQLTRQGFGAHDADMAARARDLEQHHVLAVDLRRGRKSPRGCRGLSLPTAWGRTNPPAAIIAWHV